MLLIDADYLTYRIPFSCQTNGELTEPEFVCKSRLRDAVVAIFEEFDCDGRLYLTGKGNYRHSVATIQPYKGNRDSFVRPHYYQLARDYLVDSWGATVVDGWEADDQVCMDMHSIGPQAIAVHVDKDLNQIPGAHYNPVKGSYYTVTEDDADLFFWMQTLMGDVSDNIPGIRGIGPKKAEKLLRPLSPEDRRLACINLYGDDARLQEVCTLLYLLRNPDDCFKLYPNRDSTESNLDTDDEGGAGGAVLPDWEPVDGSA